MKCNLLNYQNRFKRGFIYIYLFINYTADTTFINRYRTEYTLFVSISQL